VSGTALAFIVCVLGIALGGVLGARPMLVEWWAKRHPPPPQPEPEEVWSNHRTQQAVDRGLKWFRQHGHTTRIRSTENPHPRTLVEGVVLSEVDAATLDLSRQAYESIQQLYAQGIADRQQLAQASMAYQDIRTALGLPNYD
jgi:hypothetical protein